MRIVITGSDGQLGVELMRSLVAHGKVVGTTIADMDITDPGCVDRLASLRPDWVVHAAAATDVDDCEREPERAMAVNGEGTRRVAEGCRRAGAGLVYLSTDYVFDGGKGAPYTEGDSPAPLNAYGRSKLEGERAVQSVTARWVIVRTAWLYGTHGKNFVKTILGKVEAGGPLRVVDDQVGSPTYAADLARAVALLVSRRLTGVFHVTNSGSCSWYEFTREILRLAGADVKRVSRISSEELNRPARRPAFSVLENAAWRAAGLPPMRPWPEGLTDMLAALKTVDYSIRRRANEASGSRDSNSTV
jgi:dTDP-4-dehydrorhamnose reductase